jgi:hypothetical protein
LTLPPPWHLPHLTSMWLVMRHDGTWLSAAGCRYVWWCGGACMCSRVLIGMETLCVPYPSHGPSPQAVAMPGRRSGMGGAGQRWHENCFAGYKHGAMGVRDEYRPLNCRLHPVGVVSAGWRSPPAQTRRKTPFCSGLKPAMSAGSARMRSRHIDLHGRECVQPSICSFQGLLMIQP